MATLTFLGTSSSVPTVKRDNTSLVFRHNHAEFLIDCPGAVVQKLMKTGLDFKKIRNLIITHHHPDHLYGIISLIHTQAYLNDRLTIFSSAPSIKIIKQLITLFGLDKKYFPAVSFVNVFKKPVFYRSATVNISAVRNKHTVQSFGIKISWGKKSLFYSSDTSFSIQMLRKAGRINYLIHDCTASSFYFKKHPLLVKMHSSSKMLADYLKNDSRVKLIPVHFLLLKKNEENRIKKELNGVKNNVIFVNDLDKVTL